MAQMPRDGRGVPLPTADAKRPGVELPKESGAPPTARMGNVDEPRYFQQATPSATGVSSNVGPSTQRLGEWLANNRPGSPSTIRLPDADEPATTGQQNQDSPGALFLQAMKGVSRF